MIFGILCIFGSEKAVPGQIARKEVGTWIFFGVSMTLMNYENQVRYMKSGVKCFLRHPKGWRLAMDKNKCKGGALQCKENISIRNTFAVKLYFKVHFLNYWLLQLNLIATFKMLFLQGPTYLYFILKVGLWNETKSTVSTHIQHRK